MQFPITSLYAAILALMLVALAAGVIRFRVGTGTSLYDEGNKDLRVAIRRHANFAEYIPFALLLMALSEAAAAPSWMLHSAGVLLIGGRILHAIGLKADKADVPARIVGMVCTLVTIISLAIYLGMQALA